MREGNFNRAERVERVEKGLGVSSQELGLAAKNAKSAKPWPMVRLGDVCEVINGLWKGTKEPLVNVGVIRATNFTKQCEFDVTKTVFIDVEEKKFLKRKLQFGDIIVERSGGGPNQPVGRVIYFDQKDGNYSLSNFTSALRVKNSIDLDPYFLYRVLVACYVTGVTEKMQSNSVQLRNIDFERYLNIQILLPPLSVQKETVERLEKDLGEADKVMAEFKRMVELADKEFKAELDEMFNSLSANSASPREIKNDGCVGFVTRGATEDAEKWPMARLGDVCEFLRNGANIRQQKGAGGIPITRIETLSGGVFNRTKVGFADIVTVKGMEHHLVKKGDLLISHINSEQFVGRTVMYRGEIAGELIHGMNLLRARIREDARVTPCFVECFLKSKYAKEYLSGVTKKSVNQASANAGDIKKMPLPLPSLSVQNEIVAKLDAAKERCEKLKVEAERGLRATENLRKAILSEAFEL